MSIESRISEMLRTNTGASFLDSGSAYGRHWERNQRVDDFSAQPEGRVSGYISKNPNETKGKLEISVTRNVYHYLTRTLEEDKKSLELNKALTKLDEKMVDASSYGEVLEEFFQQHDIKEHDLRSGNTYEYEFSNLSQCIQFYLLGDYDYGDRYVFLQIHQGCDVRGGYTAPQVFKAKDDFEDNLYNCYIYDNCDGGMYCDEWPADYEATENREEWKEDKSGKLFFVDEDNGSALYFPYVSEEQEPATVSVP